MKGRAWKNGILTLQKSDGVIRWINYYSVDKYLGHSKLRDPIDSDLSSE